MSDEPALLRAIREHPDDDTPRLIYADWLDEHGQPGRAEFIRVQCELSRTERTGCCDAVGNTFVAEPKPKVVPLLPPAVRAVVALLRTSGARPTELLTLRPIDVDQSGDVWVYTPTKHKGTWRGMPRAVALGPAAQEILAPWLGGCDPEAFAFSPARSEEIRSRARAAARGTPRYASHMARNESKRVGRKLSDRYTHRTLHQAVARACKKAGVHFCPYMLRHLVGGETRRDFSLEHARAVLGHSFGYVKSGVETLA